MFQLWLEWDYGQDYFIFSSREDGIKWMDRNIDYSDFDPSFTGAEDLISDGLGGFKLLEIWKA